jgi:hypothetical protein
LTIRFGRARIGVGQTIKIKIGKTHEKTSKTHYHINYFGDFCAWGFAAD